MGNVRTWFQNTLGKLLGKRLCYQMVFLYTVGGALPVVLIGLYLIQGTNQILVEREKQAEIAELKLMGQDMENLFNTVNSVSRQFYFDEKLEHIASFQYQEYLELVRDYHAYTAFDSMGSFYGRLVNYISVFMENPTLVGNSRFVKVDGAIREAPWYQKVMSRGGGCVWQYLPSHVDHTPYLALTRLLKTSKSEDVGVLVMYLRMERLQEMLGSRTTDTRFILNGTQEVAGKESVIAFDEIREVLACHGQEELFQEKVRVKDGEYLMTCIRISLRESEDAIQIVSMESYRDILRQANKRNQRSILIFFCSVLVSSSLILVFSHSFSGRVERFRRQMEKAASGDFDLEPSLGGSDEISQLYGYLGTMIWDIQRLLSEIYQERLHAEQLNARQREAEFKMLASQINPHFLYNTLETIRMKARSCHQQEIEELVKMLARILRNNVHAGEEHVPLRREISLVESYLKIQQYRFEDRLEYAFQVEEQLWEVQILPLVLQPLVENSIVHGLECKEGTGHIWIRAWQEEEDCRIAVEDDGMGIPGDRLRQLLESLDSRDLNKAHIGVCNVHQRLRLKYGSSYGLTLESREGAYTRVTVRIPVSQ